MGSCKKQNENECGDNNVTEDEILQSMYIIQFFAVVNQKILRVHLSPRCFSWG